MAEDDDKASLADWRNEGLGEDCPVETFHVFIAMNGKYSPFEILTSGRPAPNSVCSFFKRFLSWPAHLGAPFCLAFLRLLDKSFGAEARNEAKHTVGGKLNIV